MRRRAMTMTRAGIGALFGLVATVAIALPPALTDQTDTLENHLGPAFYGEVRGGFRVSSAGSAIYEIPIAVPPGTAGMTPSLSLLYNSNLENGLLGLGWFLRGTTSKVTRCGKTFVQDGTVHRVNYTTTDRFCLDGQRLVLASGTYGGNGAEYRKEIDDFSRIRSYGTAGTGPAYFVEETKGGHINTYGNTGDSRIEAQGRSEAAHWMLNRVEDRFGNYYTLSYYENNVTGTYYPTRIDYTGHAGQSLHTGI
ncbi:MAG: hypothetical protein IPO20_02690 [Gammaproteobacteria bacterium]|nr:hypothetical protein [Gammaproteobacteria bacterium]